jgi:hypothetical protein
MPRIKWKLCGSAEIDEWGDGTTSLLARLAEDPGNGLAEIAPGVYRGVGPTTSPDHAAERPSWDCLSCGRPWPCDPAREHLASRLGSVALAVHMWEWLDEAVGDLRALPASELFERFLSWTRAR